MATSEENRKSAVELSIWYYKDLVGRPIFIKTDDSERKEARAVTPNEVLKTAHLFFMYLNYADIPKDDDDVYAE